MTSEVNGILVAAHELKGPLATLRQLAYSISLTEDAEELAGIQTQMVEVSDRALKQVEDLTKVARLEDGLFQLEPVAIRKLCDDVANELDVLFAANNRTLDVKYTNRARLVTANRELLHSVIYNFCLNAAHYSDIETRSRLSVKNQDRNHVRLSIRDFGPSLPKELWQKMNQGWLERPTNISMRPGSSGLGLYIASTFSEYMHARVGAIRHRDGTSFFVDLPISHQASFFPC
ncbi:MAG: HAMP domain-containing sensor histidine kinase [Candidatus Saccharibacteria bacterium]|nr:HAMP domain-containing sensor histidine kinase [Candidatus Saccharibacteria bacterium]